MAWRKQTVLLIGALMLSACGAQAILVEDTRSFVAAGRTATAGATKFFVEARQRQIDANILLVASEPSCEWGTTIRLRENFRTGKEGLCLPAGPPDVPPERTYSLAPIPLDAIKPAVALIGAMTAYLGALGNVSKPYNPQIGPAIDDVVEKLSVFTKAKAFLKATEDKRTAIVALLEYFNELRTLNGQAKQIRDYVNKNGDTFEAGRAALVVMMNAWNVGIVKTSEQATKASLLTGVNNSLRRTRDFNCRRNLLEPIRITEAAQQSASERLEDAIMMVNDLKPIHDHLRDFANGKYTAEDRIRIERENSAQIFEILTRLGNVVNAF